VKALRARSITPLEIGAVIVATIEPQRAAVQEQIDGNQLLLGNRLDGRAVRIAPYGRNILSRGRLRHAAGAGRAWQSMASAGYR
jgi:hypothetical protein